MIAIVAPTTTLAPSYDLWTDVAPGLERRDDRDSVTGDRYTFLRTTARPMTLVRIDRCWGGTPAVTTVTAPIGSRQVRHPLPWPMTCAQAIAYWTLALTGQSTSLADVLAEERRQEGVLG